MKTLIILIFSILSFGLSAHAAPEVIFRNEAADTSRINSILIDAAARDFASSGQCVDYIARRFVGTPYAEATLEHQPETLVVNLDSLDCTTFVETVLALAYTVGERRTSWRDFVYNLRKLRYRNGEVDGYASRLHYISDWIVDNIHRGNITDATRLFPKVSYIVRTLDFMSSNRDKYPALADDNVFKRIRNVEIGYRSHRFPYVKTADLGYRETVGAMRPGDAVALVSSLKNLDVAHMGFIVFVDGVPHLLHASSAEGRVVISDRDVQSLLRRNRRFQGLRFIRLDI